MIWTLEIGEPREVYVERCDHRHRLWKVEAEFAPDMDTHDVSLSWDQRRFERTGEVTAGRTPIHNHRSGFFRSFDGQFYTDSIRNRAHA
jgi:hypothetical protein